MALIGIGERFWPGNKRIVAAAPKPSAEPIQTLRVCADPNNLPYSNQRMEGFENKLAELVANDLNAKLEYTWWAQRKNFIRNSLDAGKCDLVLGLPSSIQTVSTTRPYYRSSYVFIYRKDAPFKINSLDDGILKNLRIGIHVVDAGYAPPAQLLAQRGIVDNIVGYSLFGDPSEPNPPARLIDAVARKQIDVAIAWGPLAGYFATHQSVPMQVIPIPLAEGDKNPPLIYDISMATRKNDKALESKIDSILQKRHEDVEKILHDFGVPELPKETQKTE